MLSSKRPDFVVVPHFLRSHAWPFVVVVSWMKSRMLAFLSDARASLHILRDIINELPTHKMSTRTATAAASPPCLNERPAGCPPCTANTFKVWARLFATFKALFSRNLGKEFLNPSSNRPSGMLLASGQGPTNFLHAHINSQIEAQSSTYTCQVQTLVYALTNSSAFTLLAVTCGCGSSIFEVFFCHTDMQEKMKARLRDPTL